MVQKKAKTTRASTGSTTSKKKTGADKTKPDPVKMFQGLVKSTSRVVGQAAAILEEEVAAGVVAAKEVEDSIVPTEKIRSEGTDKLVQRFRRDSHEIVDIIMDFVSVAATKAEEVTESVIKISGNSQEESSSTAQSGTLPTLVVPKSVKPGEIAKASMVLENESSDSKMRFGFIGSDLISATGGRIANRYLSFNPKTVSLAPKAKGTVAVKVNVPKTASPGSYSGLIRASGMTQLRAEIVLEVSK